MTFCIAAIGFVGVSDLNFSNHDNKKVGKIEFLGRWWKSNHNADLEFDSCWDYCNQMVKDIRDDTFGCH
jgi:hypothetical protein